MKPKLRKKTYSLLKYHPTGMSDTLTRLCFLRLFAQVVTFVLQRPESIQKLAILYAKHLSH